MNWLPNLFRRSKPEQQSQFGTVCIEAESVSYSHPDGKVQRIRWDDIAEVGIVTTDEGPGAEDVYFMILASDRLTGCAIPHSADGNEALLARLQSLPRFDNGAFIEAMGSTSNRNFKLWKKE